MTRTTLAVAAALVLVGPAFAQDKRGDDKVARQEIESKLKNLKVTLDFKSVTLQTLADYIREITDINIFVSNKVEGKGDDISIKVQDITLKSVLNLVLKPRQLTYVVKDGVLYLTTQEEANQDVIMEIYDVRDLLYVIPDFPGVDISLATDTIGTNVVDAGPTSEGAALPLEDLVKAHCGPKTWDENPKASLALQNGLLVVKQTREVHAQVRRLIGQLRQFK
jgi:type II secretory pathway component GspD/PulD (secretin)